MIFLLTMILCAIPDVKPPVETCGDEDVVVSWEALPNDVWQATVIFDDGLFAIFKIDPLRGGSVVDYSPELDREHLFCEPMPGQPQGPTLVEPIDITTAPDGRSTSNNAGWYIYLLDCNGTAHYPKTHEEFITLIEDLCLLQCGIKKLLIKGHADGGTPPFINLGPDGALMADCTNNLIQVIRQDDIGTPVDITNEFCCLVRDDSTIIFRGCNSINLARCVDRICSPISGSGKYYGTKSKIYTVWGYHSWTFGYEHLVWSSPK